MFENIIQRIKYVKCVFFVKGKYVLYVQNNYSILYWGRISIFP